MITADNGTGKVVTAIMAQQSGQRPAVYRAFLRPGVFGAEEMETIDAATYSRILAVGRARVDYADGNYVAFDMDNDPITWDDVMPEGRGQ